MSIDIEVVLFDLGGVLVELYPSPFPDTWLPDDQTFDSIDWFKSETAMQFECGALSPEAFASGLQRELDLRVDISDILEAFTRWPIGLFDGAHELLTNLQQSHQLAALTNTNALHWPRLVDEFRLSRYFTEIFTSHRMQVAKPDRRAFRHVLETLEVKPERLLFFDDNPVNVEAANSMGILGRQACSFGQLKEELDRLGLTSG